MPTLPFHAARECVVSTVAAHRRTPPIEEAPLLEADGRVLAEDLVADRDYPALSRSIRDGYAVRHTDVPGRLRVTGEVRAGEVFKGTVGPGEAVEIMTGAPVPEGADAVVMIEYVKRDGHFVLVEGTVKPGQFINPKASEASRGKRLLGPGRRLDFSTIALAATIGKSSLKVFAKPRVAIIATGDEVVPAGQQPLDHQVRNSNAYSLAVQVSAAGGQPEILPVAPDEHVATRKLIERGLRADLLLLSGGVSAGKYDIVEDVLAGLGAEFFFDRVLIQPGQPVVFGRARGVFFFGLPGNPASTMVTFRLFGSAAVQLLGGQSEVALPIFQAKLTAEFRHKTGLTRFLPAVLSTDGGAVTPLSWQGSSDVPAIARANAFLVAEADRESWMAGEPIGVLLK